jgi:23S rRNA pseudouridine1911/1915/1917 synthase
MTHFFQFHIEQSDAGLRLDEFFAAHFGSLSRMRIANLIDEGACLVNGAVARPGYHIMQGDAVEVSFEDGAPTSMTPEPIPLEVIYEDEQILIVVKPAGMLVHPTVAVKTGTLANALTYHLNKSRIEDGGWTMEDLATRPSDSNDPQSSILDPQAVIRPGLVHRLDRATSGLILVARTPRALTILSRHFRKRLVEKRYLALVSGNVDQASGSMTAPIGRDPDQRPHWRIMDTGKVAETRFRVIQRMRRVTLLELTPVTGRTNQLRIHCAHIGHPIVGDEVYGDCEFPISNFELKSEDQIETRQSAILNPQFEIRLCLHASSLAFHHPAGGEWMEFASAAPDDMQAIIGQYQQ